MLDSLDSFWAIYSNLVLTLGTSSLLARVTTFTTMFGAEAAVEGMKYLDQLDVYSVQELHAQLQA